MDARALTARLLAKKRRRLTLHALADVESDRMCDHAEIEAWVARLAAPKRKGCR